MSAQAITGPPPGERVWPPAHPEVAFAARHYLRAWRRTHVSAVVACLGLLLGLSTSWAPATAAGMVWRIAAIIGTCLAWGWHGWTAATHRTALRWMAGVARATGLPVPPGVPFPIWAPRIIAGQGPAFITALRAASTPTGAEPTGADRLVPCHHHVAFAGHDAVWPAVSALLDQVTHHITWPEEGPALVHITTEVEAWRVPWHLAAVAAWAQRHNAELRPVGSRPPACHDPACLDAATAIDDPSGRP